MQVDSSQYPLLEEVSEVFRGESAVARRAVHPPAELEEGLRALPISLQLEFLAEVGSLVYPDRILLGMREVRWFNHVAEPPSSMRLVGRARREGPGAVEVSLALEPASTESNSLYDDTASPIPLCRALLQFEHAYRPSPWLPSPVEDPKLEQLHNGRPLYMSAAGPTFRELPEALQVVTWARLGELGRIQGGIIYPRQLARVLPPSRLQVAPAALEGSLHLTQWLWYAFAGESSRVMTLSEAHWYRLPRREERLLCDVLLRGTSGGLATFDALLHTQDGMTVLELHGIGVAPLPAEEPMTPLPRADWQSFVKSLTPR